MIDLASPLGILGPLNSQCQPAILAEFAAGILLPGSERSTMLIRPCLLRPDRPFALSNNDWPLKMQPNRRLQRQRIMPMKPENQDGQDENDRAGIEQRPSRYS